MSPSRSGRSPFRLAHLRSCLEGLGEAPLVLDCRYYAATCRAALGENTEALAGFRAFLADWSPTADTHDERWLDARRQVGLLLASAGGITRRQSRPCRTFDAT